MASQILAEGPSGIVELVVAEGQVFARKTIPVVLNPQDQAKVIEELKKAYGCQHPYIVNFFGAVHDDNNSSIVLGLEYMDLGSLLDIYTNDLGGPIPEPVLGKMCSMVVDALATIHARPYYLVHRDLKPGNILCNSQGQFKITDFGLSSQLTNTVGKTQTFVGPVNYMSPERISGLRYTFNSDVWALGVILVECALGRFPYAAAADSRSAYYDLLDAIVEQDVPSLPPDQFSPEFCDFVSSCLVKLSEGRRDAEELKTHPFIAKYAGHDISQWIAQVREKKIERGALPLHNVPM